MNNEQITPMTVKNSTPPQLPPAQEQHPYYFDWSVLAYIGIAFIFGMFKYLYTQLTNKRAIKLLDMFVHASIGAMSGYVALSICSYLGIDSKLTGAIAGVCGFAGVEVIKKFEAILLSGLGDRLKNALNTFINNDDKK